MKYGITITSSALHALNARSVSGSPLTNNRRAIIAHARRVRRELKGNRTPATVKMYNNNNPRN